MMNRYHSIRDIKARRIGGLPGCPRTFYLVGALDRNSTTQMKRVITGLPPWQWIDALVIVRGTQMDGGA